MRKKSSRTKLNKASFSEFDHQSCGLVVETKCHHDDLCLNPDEHRALDYKLGKLGIIS